MKGFIVYPTYEVIDSKAYVCLYGRLENGQSFLTINNFKPYFYIKKKDLKTVNKVKGFEVEENKFKNFDDEEVAKIILNLPADVPKLKKMFEELEVKTYEADIRFAYRFMIDNGIQGSLDIKGDFETGERVDRVYREPEVNGIDYRPENLRVLSFDIESGKDTDDSLYCIGYVCGDLKQSLIVSKEKVKNVVLCEDDEDLIEKFMADIINLDPDVITGWNIIDFDLTYLANKCKKFKISFDIGRIPGKIKIRSEGNFFRDSKADVVGRQVLDGLNMLRVSFVKVDDFKLDTVAKQILGDGKLIHTTGIDKYKEIDEAYKNNKEKLIAYNLKDADLVLRIIEKTGILNLSISRSLLTGMPLDRVNASIASLDSLYIREAIKRKIVVPGGHFAVKEEPIKGGYVRESKPGIYDYILVLDFKSLYPSMMRTFNIDPYSYVKDCTGRNLIKAPNGVCFRNEDGILPSILEKLYYEREEARKNKDELTRYAVKILMNSFFGVLGNPSCRFFDMGLVNAITYFGQYLIKMTSDEIEKFGYKVIYADTDSNFVISKAKNLDEANKIGAKISSHINSFYNNFIKKEYNRTSYLELSYDKCFVKFLMPKLRNKEGGAKKRYAGMIIKDGKEDIQFTGLEFIRSDWTELSKKFQNELLDKVFHNKEVTNYIKKFVKDLKSGKYDELLVYKKNIRKELVDYTRSTPPHVKAARKMKKLDSTKIEYIMTEDGPEPIQNLKHKIDYEHYIEKQIKPIALQVLTLLGKDFDDIVKSSRQKKLF